MLAIALCRRRLVFRVSLLVAGSVRIALTACACVFSCVCGPMMRAVVRAQPLKEGLGATASCYPGGTRLEERPVWGVVERVERGVCRCRLGGG